MELCLQMRDTETYYSYMRRMKLLAERAQELRDIARDTWAMAREEYRRVIWDSRDLPSTSIRPPSRPPPTTYRFPYHPPTYTLDPAGASSSRGPRSLLVSGPSTPIRLGIYARGPPEGAETDERVRSPSLYYTPGMLSPRGYTGIDTDSEDGYTTVSAGSGYYMRVPVVLAEGTPEVVGATSVGQVSDVALGTQENEAALGSQESGSTIMMMWEPDTLVVEVVDVSSEVEPEGQELMGELADSEEPEEEEELTLSAPTSSIATSTGDPDYVPGL